GRGAITLIAGAEVAIIGTGCPGHLEAVSRAEGTGARASLGHIAGAGHGATERAGQLEAVGRAGGVRAIAGRGHTAGARRGATECAGVAGWMLAGGRGAITLVQRADVAISGTGCPGRLEAVRRTGGTCPAAGRGHLADVRCGATERAGVAGRMLADRTGTITLIERADVAIIRTDRAG